MAEALIFQVIFQSQWVWAVVKPLVLESRGRTVLLYLLISLERFEIVVLRSSLALMSLWTTFWERNLLCKLRICKLPPFCFRWCGTNLTLPSLCDLTLYAPVLQNGLTHSNNSLKLPILLESFDVLDIVVLCSLLKFEIAKISNLLHIQ